MKKKITVLLFALLLSLAAFTGCTQIVDEPVSSASSGQSSTPAPEPVKEPVTIKLVAAGDNLIHSTIYKQAKARATDGGYDFSYAYEHVKKLINGDINILNQETLLASPPFEPSNYPLFSSPTQVGDLMTEMGFNVFTLANNHMLDKGEKGFLASLDYWDTKEGVLTSGAYRNRTELEEIRTVTKKDVTMGLLSITEHTNGLSLPSSSELGILYTSDEATIEKQIKATEEQCDFTVVAVHWGVENSFLLSEEQKELAKKMVSWGADLIIGTHPHVLQPIEFLDKPDGGKALVAYSLGNFISAMNVAPCMLGGVLNVSITKNYESGTTEITAAELVPVVGHYDSGYKNNRVYPLSEYTEELASSHGIRKYDSRFSYSYIKKILTQQIDREFVPEEFQAWYES